jgi:nucleotide-binding universal stress UspA family protein
VSRLISQPPVKELIMFKRILLATDGSPVVERQVLYAEHLARVEPAEIIVLHAYAPPEHYANYAGYEQLLEQYRVVAQAVVDEVVNELQEDGVTARGEARLASVAEAILGVVLDEDIDLVILGRGGGGSLQALLGSVSAHVLRHARCPVLQIP